MRELGKDPRWYSLRSIRQGASTTADQMEMPEVFLRATGGWKGKALERYRKDRLPAAQGQFASRLGAGGNDNYGSIICSKQRQERRPDRPTWGTRGSIRAAIAPRRLPSRSRRTECASENSQPVRRPVYASESSEFERECAQMRGTNSLPQRYVTHEVLSGKCRLGQNEFTGGNWKIPLSFKK